MAVTEPSPGDDRRPLEEEASDAGVDGRDAAEAADASVVPDGATAKGLLDAADGSDGAEPPDDADAADGAETSHSGPLANVGPGSDGGDETEGGAAIVPPPVYRVAWDVTRALVSGSGCSLADNAVISPMSGGVAIDFRGFGVKLLAGDSVLSGRSSCIVRIPVTIPTGLYVSRLVQKAVYSAGKSSDSSGELVTKLGLFGLQVPAISVPFRAGAPVRVQGVAVSRVDSFGPGSESYATFCSASRSTQGLLALDLAISGQRRSSTETFSVSISSHVVREGADLVLAPCGS